MKFEFKRFQSLTREQALALLEIRNQEYVRKNMYDMSEITPEAHLGWISRLAEKEDRIYWAIFLNGQIIGCIDLTSIDRESSFAEWGYYIAREYFGVGAVVEFLGLDHFMEMGFKTIKAGVKEDNRQVYDMHIGKFGFKPCERFSSEIDGIRYLGASLSSDDWGSIRGGLQSKMGVILKRVDFVWE